ncbi:low molecular weight protein-tyrosine-phosphatase [Litchfieldella xinjiangensis]|uniref:low molecular weight protein-tyrosine-phosphatase n=1 Tax=Litchfieldella xinjiangensis TaxID=1166948 RepID=UPI0005BE8E5D|nr:low molecular weight protein-tyrosine-phosphatase [Halomonas xinjiangensis]
MKFDAILVVCTGNICRSPVAAALLSKHFPQRDITSAGLGALVGRGVAPHSRELAEADGLDVSAHRARQLEASMLGSADLVLVMSDGQRRAVGDNYPSALGKTMLFGHWLEPAEREIPDPYGLDRNVFEHVHGRLLKAARAWSERI